MAATATTTGTVSIFWTTIGMFVTYFLTPTAADPPNTRDNMIIRPERGLTGHLHARGVGSKQPEITLRSTAERGHVSGRSLQIILVPVYTYMKLITQDEDCGEAHGHHRAERDEAAVTIGTLHL